MYVHITKSDGLRRIQIQEKFIEASDLSCEYKAKIQGISKIVLKKLPYLKKMGC